MTLTRREALSTIAAVGGDNAAREALAALGLGPSSHRRPQPLQLKPDAGQGASVLVLGAGIAGLVSALELRRAGFRVKLLEARERVGGRTWTLRNGDRVDYRDGRSQTVQFDQGLYFNAGPARIPSQHRTLLDYCAELGVPLEVLVNSSHGAQVRPDLAQPAFTVGQAINDARGHLAGLLATAVKRDALDDVLSAEERTRLLAFLQVYGDLSQELAYEGSLRSGHGESQAHPGALPGSLSPVSLERLLHPELWGALLHSEFPEFSATMFQPVGGMDRITDAFYQRLREQVQLGAEVRRIRQLDNGVAVTWHDHQSGLEQVERADYLVATIPLPLLARLDTDFSEPVKAALREAPNGKATKVAWQSPRFWETDYRIYGGLSWVEHPARLLWYPSNDLNTREGLVVAGYVTGDDAQAFGEQPFDAQFRASSEAVELLHPGYSTQLRHPLAVSWEQIPFSEGPWLERDRFAAQASALLEEPHGRVYFAGDGLVQSGVGIWQESAANSARHAVARLAERVIEQRQKAQAGVLNEHINPGA
ncbi:FAD-dependent oxidoreductase [Pseudomonas sp. 21LCFQ010]|uniref:flavin monoamine oxidase family protein n=1 Tax=Pseudomonas sp. 21LCFQ010 TaxID=2957506 RepID=UPI0020976F80|nr:FAD-dependent oxidoreductase [Pseudomonas sp. 21LCFQ010]MCO8165790.1 FAD-dependent oxidoreductase [Pseudomonas sp. 21LCFQ010]